MRGKDHSKCGYEVGKETSKSWVDTSNTPKADLHNGSGHFNAATSSAKRKPSAGCRLDGKGAVSRGGCGDSRTAASHCQTCGAPEACITCGCLAAHYCGAVCQKQDLGQHRGQCSEWLLAEIEKKKMALQGKMTEAELDLARIYHTVGDLLSCPSQREKNYTEALIIWGKWESDPLHTREDVFDPLDSINTRRCLGQVFHSSERFEDAAQVLGEALKMVGEVLDQSSTETGRTNEHASHRNRPLLHSTQALILRAIGAVHVSQGNVRVPWSERRRAVEEFREKTACALNLFESALSIQRQLDADSEQILSCNSDLSVLIRADAQHALHPLIRQTQTSALLFDIVEAKLHLEMFEEAQDQCQEVIDMRKCVYGNENAHVAEAHSRMGCIFGKKASAQLKRGVVGAMGRVRIHALKSAAQYNGLVGTLIKEVGDDRICVRLDCHGKELSLKADNMILLSTVAQYIKQLRAQEVAQYSEALRISVAALVIPHSFVPTIVCVYGTYTQT